MEKGDNRVWKVKWNAMSKICCNENTMALLPVILSEKKIVTRVVEMNDSFSYFKTTRYYRKKLPKAWF